MTLRELKQEILNQGYHEVTFNVSREQVEKAMTAYFDFLALPEEEKEKWKLHLKMNDKDRGSELGHWRRQSASGFGYDDKAFFHYNAELKRQFRDHPDAPKELVDFIDATDPIYRAASVTVGEMLKLFVHDYPPIADPFSCYSVLRFLKYDQAPAGEFLARGHYDRGACSLAIAESAPGLRIGNAANELREVIHTEGKAFFFPALFMEQKTNNDFPASWHDVVQKSEDAFRDDTARWALVFFAVPSEPSYFDRELVHTQKQQ